MDKKEKKKLLEIAQKTREMFIRTSKINGLVFVFTNALLGYDLNNAKKKTALFGAWESLNDITSKTVDDMEVLASELYSLLKKEKA